MTHVYMPDGARLRPTSPAAIATLPTLSPGTYTIKVDMHGFFFEPIENFSIPQKLYGDTMKHTARILNTFFDRPAGTGVMLSGDKGGGKSLLAKNIARTALDEHGIVTIVVNTPLCGEGFNTLMQGILQPAVVIFDEYEKVYNKEQQQQLLTLLDGMYPSKKLFVLTTNSSWAVDEHMINRPGRIFYHLKFSGLSEAEILGYCQDNLKNQAHAESVVRCAALFRSFNFDLLKAMVEEMNRYDETATQVFQLLNADPNSGIGQQSFDIAVYDSTGTKMYLHHPTQWSGAPMTERGRDMGVLTVNVGLTRAMVEDVKAGKLKVSETTVKNIDEDGHCDFYINFTPGQFDSTQSRRGSQVFVNEQGYTLVFTPYAQSYRSYTF